MKQPCLLVLLFLVSSSAFGFGQKQMKDNRPDAAAALLSAFQGTCGSQGAATASANSQTALMITMVNTLKSTDACKPFEAQLNQIQTAAGQIQALQESSSYQTYQTDQNALQILTLALQNTDPSSPEYAQLQTTIQSTRMSMYTDQSTYNAAKQSVHNDLIASNSASMLTWGQQLLNTSSSTTLNQCLSQSPTAALQMGANLIAYGGSFLPTMYGAAVSAAAQIFSIGAQLFHDGQYDDAIAEQESDQMPDALNCALESMTDSYCSVNDSESLVKLAAENRNPDYTVLPLWQGIDILGRQLPALVNWLTRIQNGVTPQDPYQASKQIAAINELLTVQIQNLAGIAAINFSIAQYNSISDVATKNNVIINGIASSALSLAGIQVSGGGGTVISSGGPFSTLQSNAFVWACWLVQGYFPYSNFTETCPDPVTVLPTNSINGTPSLGNLVGYLNVLTQSGQLLPAIVPNLPQNWNSAESKVEALADADFSRVIVTNAIDLLSDAGVPSGGSSFSPRQVLGNLDHYIQSMMQYPSTGNSNLTESLVLEKAKIDLAIRQIDGANADLCPPIPPVRSPLGGVSPNPNPSPTPVDPITCQNLRLVKIFNLFGLMNGSQGLSTEIQDLVNTDQQLRFQAGEFPVDKTDLLKTAGTDLYIRLQEAGLGDLGAITTDLTNALGDYEANIRAFREFYEKAFEQAIDHEAVFTPSEKESDGPYRPHGQKLGQLCMFWLFSSGIPGAKFGTDVNWPNDHVQQICSTATFYNGNDRPDASGKFTPTFRMPDLEKQMGFSGFADRVCTFHAFKMHNEAQTLYAGSVNSPRR